MLQSCLALGFCLNHLIFLNGLSVVYLLQSCREFTHRFHMHPNALLTEQTHFPAPACVSLVISFILCCKTLQNMKHTAVHHHTTTKKNNVVIILIDCDFFFLWNKWLFCLKIQNKTNNFIIKMFDKFSRRRNFYSFIISSLSVMIFFFCFKFWMHRPKKHQQLFCVFILFLS